MPEPDPGSFSRGFFAAGDELANFINALDSSDMTGRDVRSAIYAKLMTMWPPALRHRTD